MSFQDPIADFCTRVRNAQLAKHNSVQVAFSKMKLSIANILQEYGYIGSVEVVGEQVAEKMIVIGLKYYHGKSVIRLIERVSKPGKKIFSSCSELPVVNEGMGMTVVSSNQGIVSDAQARKNNVGGEVLLKVF